MAPSRVHLICLPFAGGTAVTYRTWKRSLPAWIDVVAVELPGHGTRLAEPQKTTMDELVRVVLPTIEKLASPVALFGHSMGARLGYELCRALTNTPVHLFASGAPGPQVPRRRNLAQLSRTELIAELARMNPAAAEVYQDEDLMELLLPIIHTDLALSESYRGTVDPPIDVPITVLTGSADEDVTLDETRAWKLATTRAFAEPVVYDGGHFFLDAHAKSIQEMIVDTLGAYRG
ncbi:MAG TPA: alpha/beta fold hydrolase [Kofleriaceae bacterium]